MNTILEPFIDAPEGVSLLSSNGKYVSRMGHTHMEATKSNKDPYTKFLVSKTKDGKVRFQADTRQYCGLVHRDPGSGYYFDVAPRKGGPNKWCSFEAFNWEGGLVLKGHNGKYVGRVQTHHKDTIQAAKAGPNSHCKFLVSIGDIIPPQFEILSVTWDGAPEQSIAYAPKVVVEDTYTNGGSENVAADMDLKWSHKSEETTTWERAWGLAASFTFRPSTKILGTLLSWAEFAPKISYDGSKGAKSTKANEVSFERKVSIVAAPHKKTTVKMVVKMAEHVDLAFTATIRRIDANGKERILTEQGRWSGVSYHSVDLKTVEEDIELR